MMLFPVIIVYVKYLYTLYFTPYILAIRVGRDRFFVWFENQPVGIIQTTRPLSFHVFLKFMIVAGQMSDIFQSLGSKEVTDTL